MIKSKDISHLDNIIEEYISLDIINHEMLFEDTNTFAPELSRKYTINYDNIERLSINERRLDENIKNACNDERKFNEEFKVSIKLHGLHIVKEEIEQFLKIMTKIRTLRFKLDTSAKGQCQSHKVTLASLKKSKSMLAN